MKYIPDAEFESMVDELRLLADRDGELRIGLDWIDVKAKEGGVSFYEMFFRVLQRYIADEKAKEWMSER